MRQSIIPWTSSSLFWIEKLMKLVSTSIRKGGPRSVLWERKSLEHEEAQREPRNARQKGLIRDSFGRDTVDSRGRHLSSRRPKQVSERLCGFVVY